MVGLEEADLEMVAREEAVQAVEDSVVAEREAVD